MFLNPLFKHRYQADLVAPRGGDGGRTSEIRDAESGAGIKIRKQYKCHSVKATTQRKTPWFEVTQQTG